MTVSFKPASRRGRWRGHLAGVFLVGLIGVTRLTDARAEDYAFLVGVREYYYNDTWLRAKRNGNGLRVGAENIGIRDNGDFEKLSIAEFFSSGQGGSIEGWDEIRKAVEAKKEELGRGSLKHTFKDLACAADEIVAFKEVLEESGLDPDNIVALYSGAKKPNLWPTHDNILARVDSLMRTLTTEDTLIVVINGHGTQESEEEAVRFYPADVTWSGSEMNNTILLPDIVKKLHRIDLGGLGERNLAADRLILIANLCRGQIAYEGEGAGDDSSTRKGDPLGDYESLRTMECYSCGVGQNSYCDKNGRNRFFSALLDGWRGAPKHPSDENSNLTFPQLDDYLRSRFSQNPSQAPCFETGEDVRNTTLRAGCPNCIASFGLDDYGSGKSWNDYEFFGIRFPSGTKIAC